MLGYIGYRAARGQLRMYQKSRRQKGGPWTFTAVLFCILPFTVLRMLTAAAQGQALFWVLLPVNVLLVLLAVASSGLLGRRKFESKVMNMYAQPELDLTSAAAMRARASKLAMTAPDGLPQVPGEPDDRDSTEDLFLQGCTGCRAQAGTACDRNAADAVPVVLVRQHPLQFCHFERIAAGVRAGTVPLRDLEERFGGQLPAELTEMLEQS